MAIGLVYVWETVDAELSGGELRADAIELPHLLHSKDSASLCGRYVDVFSLDRDGTLQSTPFGQTQPAELHSLMFDPCAGGLTGEAEERLSASRFAQVNVYYHLSVMAEQIDEILLQLGEKPLPKVQAIVNAHEPIRSRSTRASKGGAKPVSGVAYRYPSGGIENVLRGLVPRYGQLLFGPGSAWTDQGWLSRISGGSYFCNPAHIAGFIYQGYGRHVVRHTADIHADALSAPRDTLHLEGALEAAITSYFAAAMLSTPHIWCWHRDYGPERMEAESLAHDLHMGNVGAFMTRPDAFATRVLAGCLWDIHKDLSRNRIDCLKLVVSALLYLGRLSDHPFRPDPARSRRLRSSAGTFASCLLHAARLGFGTDCERAVHDALAKRGLEFETSVLRQLDAPSVPRDDLPASDAPDVQYHFGRIREKFADAIIPEDNDLIHPDDLALHLRALSAPYDLAAVGDVMPGMRMRHRIRDFGEDYPFAWVKPLLSRSALVTGNLEGPFSSASEKQETTRNFSYKVNPKLASVISRGGFSAMTIANNHIQDCGRDGVIETIDALEKYSIRAYGGGRNDLTSHDPAIWEGSRTRIGLLGYYWNGRTAARGDLPGSARDLPHLVAKDMESLRPLVDRIVVMVHWGIPYEREPLEEDRAKAHRFIDLGADAVIGHHPHILQRIEVYKGRPIFYSVGNFAFGSGNSKAESILPCLRFTPLGIDLDIFPIYVQNRDPRLNYQPKVIGGVSGAATIDRLLSLSPDLDCRVERRDYCLRLSISAS